MTSAPDVEFAKIFALLNAFEQLDNEKQRAFLKSTEPRADAPTPVVPEIPASDPKAQNNLAANIMAAMAKLTS
jgi:hypothetical protein